ncbi:MAG: hypothetical protein JWP85_1579 [Rhodoglobus sp.]|nr:hypothetical protein [Rhodoglobus sp.]
MDSRWARLARGFTAAGFATFVAAFSHAVAGGAAPSAFGILASFVLSASVCTILAGRTLSLVRLTASVAVSQALFHGLFSSVGTPVAVAHDMAAMGIAPPVHEHSGGGMWLAHVIAALVTILAFRYAEAAFWGLANTARLALARLLALTFAVPVPLRPTLAVPERTVLPADLAVLLSSMRHRGPPAACAAA